MELRSKTFLLLCVVVTCLFFVSAELPAQTEKANSGINSVRFVVEAEDVVTRYAPANNGAGPLWCYGSTVIARSGNDVYLSVI